ncbi:MAG: methyltransferase domain-containing protein [Hyphomicrobiales bacterium]|nr:methyltransferase domain-containing protein [Hyphomicrobiales bacterium]
MSLDVVDLRDFYANSLGGVTREILRGRIRQAWPDTAGMNIAGIGYALPYLDMFNEARRVVALMPDSLGVVASTNTHGNNRSALVLEDALPLADSSVDRILLIHCMEVSETLRPLLRQIWRVLAPQGRLLLVLPNRLGMWARIESTPFGHGRPWTRAQLMQFLRAAMYAPEYCRTCLSVPPWSPCMRWANGWERIGSKLYPGLAGLLIAEATKQVHAPIRREGLRAFARRQKAWQTNGNYSVRAPGYRDRSAKHSKI